MIFNSFGGHEPGEAHPAADVVVVLVSPLKFLHMCSQVRVDEAHRRAVEVQADGHASFVALRYKAVTKIFIPRYILFLKTYVWY